MTVLTRVGSSAAGATAGQTRTFPVATIHAHGQRRREAGPRTQLAPPIVLLTQAPPPQILHLQLVEAVLVVSLLQRRRDPPRLLEELAGARAHMALPVVQVVRLRDVVSLGGVDGDVVVVFPLAVGAPCHVGGQSDLGGRSHGVVELIFGHVRGFRRTFCTRRGATCRSGSF